MANNGGSVTGLWQAQSNQPIDENRNTLQNIIEESILQERTEEAEEGSYTYDELHNLRNAQEQMRQDDLEGEDEVAAFYGIDENQEQEFENDSRSVGAGSSNNASLHENT